MVVKAVGVIEVENKMAAAAVGMTSFRTRLVKGQHVMIGWGLVL